MINSFMIDLRIYEFLKYLKQVELKQINCLEEIYWTLYISTYVNQVQSNKSLFLSTSKSIHYLIICRIRWRRSSIVLSGNAWIGTTF